jgi:hypothetical protein
MELYLFAWKMLAWSITVSVLWPVMFPWAKLAYKVWHGNKPIDDDIGDELWWRSGYASLAMTFTAIGTLLLDYATIDQLGVPAGVVHIVYYLTFLALAACIMHFCYSMEDFFGGLSMAVLYLYIPTALLFVLALLIRNPLLEYVLTWLEKPTA